MLSMDVFLVVVIMVGGHEAVKEGGGKTRPPGLNCKVGEQPDLGDLRSDGKKKKGERNRRKKRKRWLANPLLLVPQIIHSRVPPGVILPLGHLKVVVSVMCVCGGDGLGEHNREKKHRKERPLTLSTFSFDNLPERLFPFLLPWGGHEAGKERRVRDRQHWEEKKTLKD